MAARAFGWRIGWWLPPGVSDDAIERDAERLDPADELEDDPAADAAAERLAALLLRPQDQRCDRCDVHSPHRRLGDELLCETCFEAATEAGDNA